jgi:hypothetical protein
MKDVLLQQDGVWPAQDRTKEAVSCGVNSGVICRNGANYAIKMTLSENKWHLESRVYAV